VHRVSWYAIVLQCLIMSLHSADHLSRASTSKSITQQSAVAIPTLPSTASSYRQTIMLSSL
jgi:hypothetical protein